MTNNLCWVLLNGYFCPQFSRVSRFHNLNSVQILLCKSPGFQSLAFGHSCQCAPFRLHPLPHQVGVVSSVHLHKGVMPHLLFQLKVDSFLSS